MPRRLTMQAAAVVLVTGLIAAACSGSDLADADEAARSTVPTAAATSIPSAPGAPPSVAPGSVTTIDTLTSDVTVPGPPASDVPITAPATLPPPTTLAAEATAVAPLPTVPIGERVEVLVVASDAANLDAIRQGLAVLDYVTVTPIAPQSGQSLADVVDAAVNSDLLPQTPDYVIVGVEAGPILGADLVAASSAVAAGRVALVAGVPALTISTGPTGTDAATAVEAAVGWFGDNNFVQLSLAAEDGITSFANVVAPNCPAIGGIVQGVASPVIAAASLATEPTPVCDGVVATDDDIGHYVAGFVVITTVS